MVGSNPLAGHERDLALGAHCQPEHPTGALIPRFLYQRLVPATHTLPPSPPQGREDLNSASPPPLPEALSLTPGRAGCGDDPASLGSGLSPASWHRLDAEGAGRPEFLGSEPLIPGASWSLGL